MYALVVVIAFLTYRKGDMITDPEIIATIESGPYADFVNRTIPPLDGNGGEALAVQVALAVVGQPLTLTGQVFNSTPTALDYSADGGNSWTPVFGFSVTGPNWSGYGPSYEKPGNFNIRVRDHDAPLVQSASVGFTVLSVLRTGGSDPYSILNFGAAAGVSQSGPDCSAALLAAFTAASAVGEEIVIPGGDWWLDNPVALNGAMVTIRGHGKGQTRLHVSHIGTAISIAPGSPLGRVTIRDLSFIAENIHNQAACAIEITYPAQASFGYQTTTLENVEVIGYPNQVNGTAPFPQTWNRGFVLNNGWSSEITNCTWFGPPASSGATTSCFIEVNGSTDTQITDCSAYYGQALVIQTGYCQGLRLTAPRVIGTDYVFLQSAQTGWTGYNQDNYSLQGLAILGGELNTNIGHIQVAALLGGFVTAANITRRPQGPSSAQVLFNLIDTSDFHIANCDWNGGPGGADIAIQFQLGVLGNGSGNSMHGSHFANMATALRINGTNGTVGSVFDGFRLSNVPLATAIIDGSDASNGNLIYFASPAGSTFPSGLVSNKDFRWAGPDNTTLFRVQSIQGAANFWKVQAAATGNPPILLAGGGDGEVNATIETTGGNLFLSAAGDANSGGLAAFYNTPGGSSSRVQFTNALAGNLVNIGTNADGLSLTPVGALYLGGASVFSGVIGGVTANPGNGGNTNKLWANGGVVCASLSSGLLPSPSFAAVTVGGQTVSTFGPCVQSNFGTVTGTIADGGVVASLGATVAGYSASIATANTNASTALTDAAAAQTATAAETTRAEAQEATLGGSITSLSGSLTTEASSRAAGDATNAAAAAAAQATANAALPSAGGTLTGALAFSTAGTISAAAQIYLQPGSQLWLGAPGGAGAVYSATIAGVTANPGSGAAGKMWNNGGVVAFAGAGAPLPAFAAGFTVAQGWADAPATASIFNHNANIVPTPPAPLANITNGDRRKMAGRYVFGEVWQPSSFYDCWPTLQNFLLYAQLMRLAQSGASLDNIAERNCIDVHLPPGNYYVSQPVIVPDGVRLGGPGRILPTPYVGAQTGGSLVSGVFDGTVNAQANYTPAVVVVPRGHLADLNICVAYDGGYQHKSSGVCIGKNWQAVVGGAVAIGAGGSGYSVGDIWVAVNPSSAPYSGFIVNVTAVDGSGAITAGTIRLGGAYALPPSTYNGGPSLQAQQWTSANGFTVFDPAHAGAFLMNKAYRSDFSTPTPAPGPR